MRKKQFAMVVMACLLALSGLSFSALPATAWTSSSDVYTTNSFGGYYSMVPSVYKTYDPYDFNFTARAYTPDHAYAWGLYNAGGWQYGALGWQDTYNYAPLVTDVYTGTELSLISDRYNFHFVVYY